MGIGMKWILAAIVSLGGLVAFPIIAQSYDFNRYSVSVWHGHRATPSFTGTQRRYLMLRTRLQDGFLNNPLTAGHYVVIEIGCGTQCTGVSFGDVANGKIIPFPLGGEDFPGLDLKTAPDSRLVVARWGSSFEHQCTQRQYVIQAARFVQVGRDKHFNTDCYNV